MGFQSIYAWKALPEAGFAKKAIIDPYLSLTDPKRKGTGFRVRRPNAW
jgi:hypothetical protein